MGRSDRQLEAIWQDILDITKSEGILPQHKEGTPQSGWMLADFGSVIVSGIFPVIFVLLL